MFLSITMAVLATGCDRGVHYNAIASIGMLLQDLQKATEHFINSFGRLNRKNLKYTGQLEKPRACGRASGRSHILSFNPDSGYGI